MGFNLSSLGLPYSVWTLACAALMPLLCAVAVFACLRRSSTARKLTCYFIFMPLYVACAVFVFTDIGSVVNMIVPAIVHGAVPVIGFMLAITTGILYLSLSSLICGAGVMRRRGATANALSTLVCCSAVAYLVWRTWDCTLQLPTSVPHEIPDPSSTVTATIADALPWTKQITFLPEAFFKSGIELVAVGILLLYILIFFLCFTANKKPEMIRRDRLERLRRETLREKEDEARRSAAREEPAEHCCAYCEYARRLRTDEEHVLCDKSGIVEPTHVCRSYLYDPLKRAPRRPAKMLDDNTDSLYSDGECPDADTACLDADNAGQSAAPQSAAPSPAGASADSEAEATISKWQSMVK